MDLPDEAELFIDIDDVDSLHRCEKYLAVLSDNDFEIIDVNKKRSRNGNWHVRVQLAEPVNDIERILLQACLGSDPKRELLSFLRLKFRLDRPPTVFFEKPE
jgi:anaerobic glycerol-3-phosphate dehydrogenase